MKVLLGGGTGFIGKNLKNLLVNKGHKVTVISRTAGADRLTWDQLRLDGLTQKYDAIFNVAGENILNPFYRWNNAFKMRLETSRIDTTKLLADLIKSAQHKPDVWVSSSAVGFYPPDPSTQYTEDSKGGRGDYLAELCRRWEEAAMLEDSASECAGSNPVRHVTVRIGVVLGRSGGTIQKAYWPFFLGLGGKIASGDQWFPWIHIDDLTSLFHFAMENSNVKGVINGTAPNPVTNAQFTSAFASALKRPSLVCVPEAYLNLVFGAERAAIMTKGQKVMPEKTMKLGYKYKYSDIKSACNQLSVGDGKCTI